jgi:hypothetical protein
MADTESQDSDGDGTGNNSDLYPNYSDTVILNFISEYISANNYLKVEDIQDLRADSTMIEVQNEQASLSMEIEESNDLGIWTTGGTALLQVPLDAEAGKKFFRFTMTE